MGDVPDDKCGVNFTDFRSSNLYTLIFYLFVFIPYIIVTKARDPAPAQQNVRASTPLTGNTPVKAPAQAPQMAKYVQPVLSANKAAPATATTKPVASNAALSF